MRRTILIVDDQERNIRLLSSLIQSIGHDVLSATSGEEACRAVAEEKPDLVLLDAMMPGMNGFEVCSWIRSRDESALLPIVIVTALNSMEERIHALEIGADDFLTKPVNRLELQAKVRSLLRVHALQEDLARKNEELRRSESLRESLTQMIIHDLKNPLTGIQGFVELMLGNELDHRSTLAPMARSIRSSCGRMMGMILDMLDVGRLEEGCDILERAPVPMAGVLDDNIGECSGLAGASEVRIIKEIPDPGPTAMADPGLIHRVVGNLLNNAIKHTPPGGHVTVSGRSLGDWVEVRIGDTGEGIPPEDLERIFDKFARVEGQGRTTRADRGLGLTFCKMAVEAPGGHIRAESVKGHGSTFTFTLPATTGTSWTAARQRA